MCTLRYSSWPTWALSLGRHESSGNSRSCPCFPSSRQLHVPGGDELRELPPRRRQESAPGDGASWHRCPSTASGPDSATPALCPCDLTTPMSSSEPSSTLPSFEARFASAHAGDADREAAQRAHWQREMDVSQLQMQAMEERCGATRTYVEQCACGSGFVPFTAVVGLVMMKQLNSCTQARCPRAGIQSAVGYRWAGRRRPGVGRATKPSCATTAE